MAPSTRRAQELSEDALAVTPTKGKKPKRVTRVRQLTETLRVETGDLVEAEQRTTKTQTTTRSIPPESASEVFDSLPAGDGQTAGPTETETHTGDMGDELAQEVMHEADELLAEGRAAVHTGHEGSQANLFPSQDALMASQPDDEFAIPVDDDTPADHSPPIVTHPESELRTGGEEGGEEEHDDAAHPQPSPARSGLVGRVKEVLSHIIPSHREAAHGATAPRAAATRSRASQEGQGDHAADEPSSASEPPAAKGKGKGKEQATPPGSTTIAAQAAPSTPAKRRGRPSKAAPSPKKAAVEEEEGAEEDEEEEPEQAPAAKAPAKAAKKAAPAKPPAAKAPAKAPATSKAATNGPTTPAPKQTPAKQTPAKRPASKAVPETEAEEAPPAKRAEVAAPATRRTAQKSLPQKAPAGRAVARPRARAAGRRKRHETYKRYTYRVLKEVHPDMGISSKGMEIMDTFAADMFIRIASEAARLCRYTNKATLTSREIQTAVRLLLPGELAKHAVNEGTKAVANATS
ncbi:hypothetical protein WJX72_005738 [[Myrmecia] bisecta]|uniref:Core Histone H2A/H2B/H3 domain-containing protein n=1 Tax=[Myrmecia] bisecta TaxID=41462 RepID=A0AAW1PTQ7_9CHLO